MRHIILGALAALVLGAVQRLRRHAVEYTRSNAGTHCLELRTDSIRMPVNGQQSTTQM